MAKSKALGFSNGLMGLYSKDSFKTITSTEEESTHGLIKGIIRENGGII